MEREWIGARTIVTFMGAILLAAGCGASVIVDEASCPSGADCRAGDGAGGSAQTAIPCVENADCNDDSVCFDGVCRFVGECTMNVHCTCAAPVCEEHACVGDNACGSSFVLAGGDIVDAGPPVGCEINADCGEKQYCVDGICHLTTECLKHAHCNPKEGCFQQLCWPL